MFVRFIVVGVWRYQRQYTLGLNLRMVINPNDLEPVIERPGKTVLYTTRVKVSLPSCLL